MKRVKEVTTGKNNQGQHAIVLDFVDSTSDLFTFEIDAANNRCKNFRTKGGSLFAKTTKSFKKKLGYEAGSSGACAIQMTLSNAWGYAS